MPAASSVPVASPTVARSAIVLAMLALIGVIAATSATSLADEPPVVVVRPSGAMQVVFEHHADACRADDVPDDGARAFRDAAGRVHLIASGQQNFAMVGDSLDDVKRVCASIYHDAGSADPSRYDDAGWLESFYTLDGRTVHALVSHDYHPERHGLPCDGPAAAGDCWYGDVLAATSYDGGETFTSPAPGPARLVAGSPYRFSADHPGPAGAFVVSNIVARHAAYYAFVSVANDRAQRGGDCLVRTQTLGVPSSWRAWDGSDFTTRFVDPYTTPAFDPAKHVCEPVAPAQLGYAVRSLLELDGGRGFIATMDGATVTPDGVHVPTVFTSTSADLVRWSAPQPVVRFEPHAAACTATSPHTLMYAYPALLDPNSPSRSFDTVGDTAYLYFLRVRRCGGLDRDLVRLPVSVSVAR